MEKQDRLLRIFAERIRKVLEAAELDFESLQEIRLRAGRPLLILYGNREYLLLENGRLEEPGRGRLRENGTGSPVCAVRPEELKETLEYIGNHSLYAFEEEIRQGFITIQGGHRIGLAGKTVVDGGEVRTMKYISFLNVRLAHQVRGCADPVMPYLYEDGRVLQTLIVSPPRCGKTTLLRDMIRQISDGPKAGAGKRQAEAEGSGPSRPPRAVLPPRGVTVGIVDERSELAACYQGIPQNDVGFRTDVLDCCPKAKGMMMLIRTMAPDVIAVDEIGSREDLEAMEYVMNCGCRLLATVHGNSLADVEQKPVLREMVENQMFERYVILSGRQGAGTIEEIRGKGGELCG